MPGKRILFVGLGDVGAQIFDLCVRIPGKHLFLVGGRNEQYLHQRTNLSWLAAIQLGYAPEVAHTPMDLWNIDQTAYTISRFQPDIIVCAATLLRWGVIGTLPAPLAEQLSVAQMGPWLPVHLALVYKLMLAVRETRLAIKVINASYPGVVNAVLGKVGLAPTTGIGELANNIPALRKALAWKLGCSIEQVEVQLVMSRYLSHRISRTGDTGGAPFHLTVLVNGENVTHAVDVETIFKLLPTQLKRIGGTAGQIMTAASAMVVFESMVNTLVRTTHAPGPNGLPGGYPVRVTADGVAVVLPDSLTIDEVIRINEDCQKFDGIERIDEKGTVYFADREMSILKTMLDYECRRMPLLEVEDQAKELQAKYLAFASKHRTKMDESGT